MTINYGELTPEMLAEVFKMMEEEKITPSSFVTHPLPKGVDLNDYEILDVGIEWWGISTRWIKKEK